MKDNYKIVLSTTVSGSPTVGGFAGYLRKGIKNIVNHIIPAKTSAFLISLFQGNEFLDNANTIPNSAPIDVPKITPARICPLFCHTRYPSYSAQNARVSYSSPDANRF